jgi:hypothetical protein
MLPIIGPPLPIVEWGFMQMPTYGAVGQNGTPSLDDYKPYPLASPGLIPDFTPSRCTSTCCQWQRRFSRQRRRMLSSSKLIASAEKLARAARSAAQIIPSRQSSGHLSGE